MAQITLTIRGDATQAQQVIEQLKSGLRSISNLQIDTSAVRSLETELQNAGKNAEAAAVQTTTAMNNQTSAVQGSGSALRDYSGAAGEAAKQTSILDNALKFTQWYFISGAVSAATRSFKEAVEEMKNVDDELVVIRKVTGATGQELENIEKQAYKTGSAYGTAANAYLESVAAFSRAGYGDLAASLAELSAKTQIVGDTDAETANQFLLSMDAAYKYKGSVEQLSRVLDGANEIDNKYATSIEKIAEGLGKVAPIAAQAHVTEAELTAAIGTITAVTQRSGTEAATALRALMLNIIGDTKTEIDEGVTWTTGEIAGLTDVIKKYAPEAYKAAEATGSVIDPMEAIGGLAKAMQEGFLTEQELMEQVSDIGGKLRTSQLLALIQNWDMYQSMLEDYGNAVGSADKEVENALDSWTRKSAILKNTWTEFISKSVDSEFFKGLLDGATAAVDFADNLGLATAAVGGLLVAMNAKKVADFTGKLAGIPSKLHAIVTGAQGAGSAITASLGAATFVISLVTMGVLHYKQAQEEARQEALEAARAHMEEVSSLEALRKEYTDLLDQHDAGSITEAEYNEQLSSIKETLVQSYGLEKEAVDKLNESRREGLDLIDQEIVKNATMTMADLGDEYKKAVKALESEQVLDQSDFVIISDEELEKAENALARLKELGFDIEITDSANDEQIMRVSAAFDNATEAEMAFAEALVVARSELDPAVWDTLFTTLTSGYQDASDKLDKYTGTLEQYAEAQAITLLYEHKWWAENVQTKEQLGLLRRMLYEASDGTEAQKNAIDDLLRSEYSWIYSLEDGSDALSDQTDALDKYSDSLDGATAAIEAYKNAADGGEKGDVFSQYADVYKDFLEHFEAGEFGSVSYQAAVKALLPEDLLRQLGYDYEEAGKLLASDFWQAVFAEGGEDHGQNFINALYEMGDGAEELGVHFEELSDGSLNVVIDDVGKLADGLGVSRDLILAVADALGIFGMYIPQTREDLLQFAQDLGAVASSSQGFRVNLQKLTEEMVSAGYSDADILGVVDSLRAIEGITLSEPKEGMQSLIDSARDAESALSGLSDEDAEPSVELDTTGFDTAYERTKARLDALGSTNVVVKVLAAHAAASGTDSAAGGPTLVNEEGPELIQEGTTARIAGGGKPTVTDLEPGARVYTAEETREILHGRAISEEIPARRLGENVNQVRARLNVPLGAYTGSSKSSSSSGSGSSGSSGNSGSTASASAGDDEQLDTLKKIVSLRESELDLLEARGESVRQQMDKITEIRSALMDQIRYMESIGEDQAEINKLTAKWYQWNDDILGLQNDLWDQLEDAVDRILDREKAARDEKLDALDAEIAAIRAAGEEQDKVLELEEKRLAVEEARSKLAEAEQERTVRYFNAATGQWEWGPNAANVKSARETLEDAEKALRDYEADLAQEAAIAEIEAKKDAINEAYDTLEQNWTAVVDSLQEPAKDISEVLREIAEVSTPEMAAQIQTVNGLLAGLGYSIQSAAGTAQGGAGASGASGGSSFSGGTAANLDAVALDVIRGKYGNGTARESALTAAGYDYNAVQTRVNEMLRSGIYDGGGVLRGLGGIKATERDEIILPPDLTEKMLAPTSGAMVRERLAELGWMYGVERAPSPVSGFIGRDTIGTQQNYAGDIYQFGGITLTEQQARNTTIYELAQLSRTLNIYNHQM